MALTMNPDGIEYGPKQHTDVCDVPRPNTSGYITCNRAIWHSGLHMSVSSSGTVLSAWDKCGTFE